MTVDTPRTGDIAAFGRLIAGIRVAMVTTVDILGHLVSRPLHTRQVEFDGSLLFFTAADSRKVAEITDQPRVNVSYSDPVANRYVSIVGDAMRVEDRVLAARLWDEANDRRWFSGSDDPNLALVRVRVHAARSWSGAPVASERRFDFLSGVPR